MADWTTTLPDTAVEGETTHIEDHNAIVAAIAEARSVLDAIEAAVTGKADAGHKHAAADISSGTLSAARIPSLDISKVTGLQAALDGKVDDGELSALADRVAALEAAATAPEA